MWLPLSLAAAVFWGAGQVLVKKGLSHVTPLINFVVISIIGLILFAPLAFYFGFDPSLLLPNLPLVLVTVGTLATFYYALNKGQVSLSGTVLATYPLFTIILARIFLLETTSPVQKIAIALILLGVMLLSFPAQNKQQKIKFLQPWLVWAISAAALIGGGDFLAKVVIERSNLGTFLLLHAISGLLISAVLLVMDKSGRKMPQVKTSQLSPTLVGVTFMRLGILAFYAALSFGTATLVTSVSSSYVAISVLLAVIFLKDKLTKLQASGIVSVIIGVILISL